MRIIAPKDVVGAINPPRAVAIAHIRILTACGGNCPHTDTDRVQWQLPTYGYSPRAVGIRMSSACGVRAKRR